MRYLEHAEQVALVSWARMSTGKYPALDLLHSSLNAGRRKPQEAARLKQAGMLAGIPDLFLPCARNGFNGLYIEMKIKGGSVTPIQKKIHDQLRNNGYLVEVCYSMEAGKTALIMYLAGDNPCNS